MKFLILSTLLISTLLTISMGASADDAEEYSRYTLYLIRHAEKELDGSSDPVLTQVGKNRAEQLATWFQSKGLEGIWSSDYHRTRDTVKPLLAKTGLKLSIYDPGDQAALVMQLKERQQTALIVGHSNTIPELARLLRNCNIVDMDETEHNRLIVISVVDDAVMARTMKQNILFRP